MAIILAIDKDLLQLEAVTPVLEANGHLVQHASDAERALVLAAGPVDMVIVEPATAGHAGAELVQSIRALNAHRPLLALSTRSDEGDIIRTLAAGADDYLVRPVSGPLLAARVEALLRRDDDAGRAERQLSAMRGMLDRAWAIPLNAAVRSPFAELARAISASLDASYCRIAIRQGSARLRLRASAGHRLTASDAGNRDWPLRALPFARQAFRDRRAVRLDFEQAEHASSRERDHLVTEFTRRAVVIPFSSGRYDGLLIVGEERSSRGESFRGESLTTLEFVAHRIGDILRMSDLVRINRLAERTRQLQAIKRLERARLARELHDEVGQSLSGLLIRLRLARSEGSISLEDINALERAAQDALDAARSVAYDLRRQRGAEESFQEAHDYCRSVLDAAGCKLVWTDLRTERPLDSRTARVVGRVINESVTNVVRHAQAAATAITIEDLGRRVRVTIQDDGKGFVPTMVALEREGRGLGLLGNRERVAQLGGTFRIESAPGEGTSVVFEIPWRRSSAPARAAGYRNQLRPIPRYTKPTSRIAAGS